MGQSNLFFLFVLSFGILCSTTSCRQNDDSGQLEPITSFTDGYFITNRGIDGSASGTISYYDRTRQEVVNEIFRTKNTTRLGGLVESMTIADDYAYILLHDEEKIIVANSESMALVGQIPNLALPRYFLPLGNDKAYVSQWGSDGGTGTIQIIDLNANSPVGEIETPTGPERMIRHGNYVYVAHSGGFFLDSVVTKIDLSTDQIVKTVEVGYSPQSLQIDKNGDLWVLSKGQESFFGDKEGTLAKLVNDEVVLRISAPLGSHDLVINNTKDKLYFINGQGQRIFEQPIENTAFSLIPFSVTPVSSLAIDPETNLPIATDAKNFQVDGELLLFDADGEVTERYDLGLVPSYFGF